MSTDPASLNISIALSGLGRREVGELLAGMPHGAHWNGTATQPAIGGMRFEVTISDLSIVGAGSLIETLHTYLGRLEGDGRG